MTPTVTLLTEGTYPLHTSGISVWCDQLVTSLAHVDFNVVALCGFTGKAENSTPVNVRQVKQVPLWEHAATRPVSAGKMRAFREIYEQLVFAVLSDDANGMFPVALHRLSQFAQTADLITALSDPRTAALTLQVWQTHSRLTMTGQGQVQSCPPPSVADALDASM